MQTSTQRMFKIGIAVFPGSNCERDIYHVLNNILNLRANYIWHTKDKITGYDAMIIPGGFSYGDRLRAGIIAANSPIINEVKRMAKDGLPILGICNGFQILIESCLLPGALMMNNSLSFVCRWTTVEVQNNKTPFTNNFQKNQKIQIPIAHGEGRYVADNQLLKDLKKNNQIVLRYFKDDPNGSYDLIAGICNEEGNVMGMMPHPERASETLLSANRSSDNAINIFRSLISYFDCREPSLSTKKAIVKY
jgi:phosphoribosylformylglycinamidine synthase subunit PurQ / glutaminase